MYPEAAMTGIVEDRAGAVRVWRRKDFPLDSVLDALRLPGELLKASHKSETRRVGSWVVKRSRHRGLGALLRHTLLRTRSRQVWVAARHLESRGVSVPRPHAYVEYGRFGLCWGQAFICDYLDGYVDVEAFADSMISRGAGEGEAAAYLERLAEAVNCLNASGCLHKDLAGKNILTRDGQQFTFIDLDAVVTCPFTESSRLRAHIQLYDSFNDRWSDALLKPFLARLLPEPKAIDSWFGRIKAGQEARRARTEAIWRKQGKR